MLNNVTVVIPCYNEVESIGKLIERLKKVNENWEIIIIDDGSSDGSSDILKEYDVRVIRNSINLGNGVSVKKGIIHATGDYIVLMDADDQHDPVDIPKLLEHVEDHDMVVGARCNKRALSKIRNLGNCIMIKLAEYLTKQQIPDLTSGFRVFKRSSALPFLPLFPTRFSYPTTLTLCMIKSSMRIKFVPLESIVKRTRGKSSINPLMDGIRFINIMIRIIMLYSPQTIFLPFGILGLGISIALTIYQLVNNWKFSPNVGIFYLASVLTILLSLIAEQIASLRFELIELSRERYERSKLNG